MVSINPDWARDPLLADRLSGPIKVELVPSFVNFVKAAVARYSAPPFNIQYWMIYAEPDCEYAGCNGYGQWGYYADRYAGMMKQVHAAVKADYPNVKIVLGTLAMDRFIETGRGPFAQSFLENAMANGLAEGIDVIAFNYFPDHAGTWSSDPSAPDILGKIKYIRSIPGAASIPMMAVEVAEQGPVDDSAQMEAQAKYVTKLYARTHSAGLLAVLYFSTREWTVDQGRALLTPAGGIKPSYLAYRYYASTMNGVEPIGSYFVPADGLESHRFRRVSGTSEVWVEWTASAPLTTVVAAQRVTLHSKYGDDLPVTDLGSGSFQVTVGPDPVYLEIWR